MQEDNLPKDVRVCEVLGCNGRDSTCNNLRASDSQNACTGGVYQQQGPSCFDQMKMGFFLGFCVDMASGALYGGFLALRTGLRGRELVNTVGKEMMHGGGSFDTFLAIGSVLRCYVIMLIITLRNNLVVRVVPYC